MVRLRVAIDRVHEPVFAGIRLVHLDDEPRASELLRERLGETRLFVEQDADFDDTAHAFVFRRERVHREQDGRIRVGDFAIHRGVIRAPRGESPLAALGVDGRD